MVDLPQPDSPTMPTVSPFLDRRRIPEPGAGEDDQQRQAHQPRKAKLPRKPPPEDLETFHIA
ncbi:hypothetical protein [Bradyrhizobium diazoefficiens]|nr:hypothetical protein XF16B_84430 [Bradyrhizobium diazoefficiens]BCF74114.1 hypothetical protein XF19B_84670 [Bradyrhizobium diazoefficiens]